MLDDCCKEHGLDPGMITVVSFRDEILKDLLQEVQGASYQDDALRTLSLVRQRDAQKKPRLAVCAPVGANIGGTPCL